MDKDIVENLVINLKYLNNLISKINVISGKDKKELIKAINELNYFIEKIPTKEDKDKAIKSLKNMEKILLKKSKNDNKNINIDKSLVSEEEIKNLYEELKELKTDEIYNKLKSKDITKKILLSLANYLNISVSNKHNKSQIIDLIVKKGFANERGYDLLKDLK